MELSTLFDILSDTYEGTEFDLSKGVGAGPYGYPHRYGGNKGIGGWERSISVYRYAACALCVYACVFVELVCCAPGQVLLGPGFRPCLCDAIRCRPGARHVCQSRLANRRQCVAFAHRRPHVSYLLR